MFGGPFPAFRNRSSIQGILTDDSSRVTDLLNLGVSERKRLKNLHWKLEAGGRVICLSTSVRSGEKSQSEERSLRVFLWQQGLHSSFKNPNREQVSMRWGTNLEACPFLNLFFPPEVPNRRTLGEPGSQLHCTPSPCYRLNQSHPGLHWRRVALPPPRRRLADPAWSDSVTAASCWAACYCFS